METQSENSCSENPSKPDVVKALRLHANVELRSVDPLRSAIREERKREAGKPLYLTRYE